MKNYLDENTRVVLKWHFPALARVFALQRRKKHGWKTVSWIYPSIVRQRSYEYIVDWMLWEEGLDKSSNYEVAIGKMIEGKKAQAK